MRFLESIPRARDLVTIFFDDDIRLSRYNSENQQGLFERIADAKGGGDTALYDAISVYLSRVQDASGRKVLVLFTDGEDTRSALSLGECLQLIRSSGVTIYPIAFTGGFPPGSARALRSKSVLEQMAELTGGAVFTPRSSKDLSGIYERILQELQAQYVLGYVSDDPARDGKFRRLKVDVSGKGCACATAPAISRPPSRISGARRPRVILPHSLPHRPGGVLGSREQSVPLGLRRLRLASVAALVALVLGCGHSASQPTPVAVVPTPSPSPVDARAWSSSRSTGSGRTRCSRRAPP